MEEIIKLRTRAWFFYDNNLKVFLKDFNDTYYSANIINISETHISFKCFEGNREGETVLLAWVDVKSIDEYKGRGVR